MTKSDEKKTDEDKSSFIGKSPVKYVVITLFIIIIVVSIFSLTEWSANKKNKVYGETLEAKINMLETRIKDMESNISSLKTRNSSLFVLVFISLIINIILVVSSLWSKYKNIHQNIKLK